MSGLLRAEELSVRRGGRTIVDGVTLQLQRGEVVALLGPNGAGKSTLLDALAGALPPAAGTVRRDGRVALALQSPDLARRSVRANLEVALAWWGVPRRERRARATAALQAIRADHLAARPAAALSGGERRRVHLARALAVDPDVLLLDEPFAGLDAETRAALLEDTATALRSADRATLVVVHDRAEAWALADRLLILMDGRLAAAGEPHELLASPPSPAVARFLGFDGSVLHEGETLLTRPAHVRLDDDGPLQGRVTRAIPLQDGMRLEVELAHGRVFTVAEPPAPRPGDLVRLRIEGGARFPSAAAAALREA